MSDALLYAAVRGRHPCRPRIHGSTQVRVILGYDTAGKYTGLLRHTHILRVSCTYDKNRSHQRAAFDAGAVQDACVRNIVLGCLRTPGAMS